MAKRNFKFFYLLSLALQLGFFIVIPLIGFLLLGIFLDKKLSTSPLFIIILLILDLIFIFFEIRYYLKPILKK